MSFDKEDVLSKLVSNMSTFEQLFPLIKVTELEAFVANELVKMFAAAGNAGNDTVLNAMISACLNFIAEFTGKESEEEFSPLITLLRTIEEASQSSAKVREAFGKSSLFSDLLMLMTLQIAKRPDRKISLTSECLRVIYFSSITDFERTIGYEQLKAVLSSFADIFFQDKTEIVDRLFELSLRTRREFFWGATVFTQNTRFIVLICELLPLMGMATIVHTLSRLYTLFQSLPNVAACSSAGLTQVLLEMLEGANVPPGSPIFSDTAVLARLVDAVRLLATHSLSAADLKRVVRLLSRTGPGDTRLSTFPYLIKCLHKTAVAEVDPSAYYNFDGRTSQFKLPSFEYWPFSHGATFFAWLRIESLARRKPVLALDKKVKRDIGFPSPAGTYQLDPAYKPRLLSFMSEDQSEGLELFISDSALYLGITSGRETDLFLCCPDKFALPEKRWFALGITFYTSLIVPTNGELRLYIDGEFVSKTSFTYPRNITSTAYNSVGSSSVPNGDIQSFNGQIGTVFFFDDTLESPQMASLFRYGPEFLGLSKTK